MHESIREAGLPAPLRILDLPEGSKRHSNYCGKNYIISIVFGSILLLMIIVISSRIMSKSFYQQKQTTKTKTTAVLTTDSTDTTVVSIAPSLTQCPAYNCPNGGTCCLTNVMWTKIRCCHGDTPVCCSPDQGWCCRIHAPVCCGNFSCCPLNTTCCTIYGVERCCRISKNTTSITVK